jgi:hypothetical protein
MKFPTNLLVVLNILLATVTQAQKSFNDSAVAKRNQLAKRSMMTLEGRADANISSSFSLSGSS